MLYWRKKPSAKRLRMRLSAKKHQQRLKQKMQMMPQQRLNLTRQRKTVHRVMLYPMTRFPHTVPAITPTATSWQRTAMRPQIRKAVFVIMCAASAVQSIPTRQIPLYMKQTRKQESRQTSLVPAIRCFHPGSMCRMENLTYSGQEMMKSGVYISMAPTTKREKACAVPSRFCGLHLSMI